MSRAVTKLAIERPDRTLRSAPRTFARKAEAVRWLTLKEAEIRRGDWIDPEHAGVIFGNYAEHWLNDRVLKLRTADLYQSLLRNHLLPAFGPVQLSDIDEAPVRRWRKERLNTGVRAARAAMMYQHATKDRDLAIAQALGGLVQQVRTTSSTGPDEASGDA